MNFLVKLIGVTAGLAPLEAKIGARIALEIEEYIQYCENVKPYRDTFLDKLIIYWLNSCRGINNGQTDSLFRRIRETRCKIK